eukprot:COSAG02_NODE_99_length_37069_cov_24.910957_14_plen_200_part_00
MRQPLPFLVWLPPFCIGNKRRLTTVRLDCSLLKIRYQMCVDGAGHDQTCKADKGCIFSPKYAGILPFQRQCHAAFGVTPQQTNAAVAFNSANYGDNRPGTFGWRKTLPSNSKFTPVLYRSVCQLGGSRIVFVNGDIDPFHFGSVTHNSTSLLAQDITAYIVAGGSHCADMGPPDPEVDSPSMLSVKLSKASAIRRWLTE